MCDGHLLLPYYSEITSGVDPIHILHPWSEGLFIREAVPGSLELFFGCQRQCGGTHENPTVQEFYI